MAWEQHSHADGETFTADDMNRMEEAIYDGGGYSSKKEWADQNVPGVEGWNRLENGILAIGSDKVSRNLWIGTGDMSFASPRFNGNASGWTIEADETAPNGYSADLLIPSGSAANLGVYFRAGNGLELSANIDVGTIFTVSFYVKTVDSDSINCRIGYALNNQQTVINSSVGTFSTSATYQTISSEWTRVWVTAQKTDDDIIVCIYFRQGDTDKTVRISGMKIETNDTVTDYSPAPEDIFTTKTWESEQNENNIINADNANRWEQGITDMLDYREKYATEETETATPQSVEDSDEIPAVEAGEIE